MRDTVDFLFSHTLPACTACQIRSVGVCANSDAKELSWLEEAKIYRSYPAGKTIVHAGQKLPYVGSVMVGVAALSRVLEDGRQQTVGLLMPGDFLGRPDRPRTLFDVTALTNVEFCGFTPSAFDQLLGKAPGLRNRLVKVTLDDLDAARAWMVTLGRKSAREKLSSLLLYFAEHQTRTVKTTVRSGSQIVHLPLTREQIADCLAMTLETVSRHFSDLMQEGLIEPVRKHVIRILDHEGLMLAAAEDNYGGLWC